jgi:hypothetical protein
MVGLHAIRKSFKRAHPWAIPVSKIPMHSIGIEVDLNEPSTSKSVDVYDAMDIDDFDDCEESNSNDMYVP